MYLVFFCIEVEELKYYLFTKNQDLQKSQVVLYNCGVNL